MAGSGAVLPQGYSIDGVRARERVIMEDGRTLRVTGSALYFVEDRRQAEGPLDAVVHLERDPDRVVGYMIEFLTQSEPVGRPTRRAQTFAPPTPPDEWRFVFTKGSAAT